MNVSISVMLIAGTFFGLAAADALYIYSMESKASAVAQETSQIVCGNGTKEAGEECDMGFKNGKPGVSCDAQCKLLSPEKEKAHKR